MRTLLRTLRTGCVHRADIVRAADVTITLRGAVDAAAVVVVVAAF